MRAQADNFKAWESELTIDYAANMEWMSGQLDEVKQQNEQLRMALISRDKIISTYVQSMLIVTTAIDTSISDTTGGN